MFKYPASNLLRPFSAHNLTLKLEALKLELWGEALRKPPSLLGQNRPPPILRGSTKLPVSLPPGEAESGGPALLRTPDSEPPLNNSPVDTAKTFSTNNKVKGNLDSKIPVSSPKIPVGAPRVGKISGAVSREDILTEKGDPPYVTNLTRNAILVKDRLGPKASPGLLSQEDLNLLKLPVGEPVAARIVARLDRQVFKAVYLDKEIQVHSPANRLLKVDERVFIQALPVKDRFVVKVEPHITSTTRVTPNQIRSYLAIGKPLHETYTVLRDQVLSHPVVKSVLQNTPLEKNLHQTLSVLTASHPQMGSVSSTSARTPEGIAEIVERSGLNYEAQVRRHLFNNEPGEKQLPQNINLKGQLMELAEKLENPGGSAAKSIEPSPVIREILYQVRQAIQNLEFHQLSQVVARQENHMQLLPLAAQLLGINDSVQIYFRPDNEAEEGGSKKNGRAFNLVFFLNLSNLGDLRIDVRLEGRKVQARIFAEGTDVVDFIQNQTHLLEQALSGLDLDLSLESQLTKKIERNIPDSLAEFVLSEPARLVDVRT